MDQIKIRKALLTDLEQLYVFEQNIIQAERSFDPTLKKEHTHYYNLKEIITSPEAEIIVAELGHTIIASGFARIERAKPYVQHARHAYLGFMYVVPEHRRKGVNKRIIGALKNWASLQNVSELRLEVYYNNVNAIKAYEKIGFAKHVLEMRLNIDGT